MFDLGGGKQFDNVEDLIEHYKEYPFEIADGRLVHLLQVNSCIIAAWIKLPTGNFAYIWIYTHVLLGTAIEQLQYIMCVSSVVFSVLSIICIWMLAL